ncbi:SRPBCC family protein [Microbacterium sp. NPDC055683]
MARIIETIDVDVDVTTAYNQWTQFESFPEFLGFVDGIRQIDDETLAWKVTIGGAEREFIAKITEQHPDERVAWTSVSGDADHAGVVTFHTLSEGSTRVTVQLDWEPSGFTETVGAALGVDDHAVKKDLARFKEFIESRGSETGAWRGDVD